MTFPSGPSQDDAHRAMRELLGSFVLGHLDAAEALGVQAHLDGCADCRADLAEIAPLAVDLRSVDPRRLTGQDLSPAPDLGARITAAVAAERVLRDRRTRRRTTLTALGVAAGVVAVLAVGVGVGVEVGRQRTDQPVAVPSPTPSVPMEPVALRSQVAGVSVDQAVLVPHTWGVEVRFVAAGLTAGEDYTAWVVDRRGARVQAGTFVGVGARTLRCNMQSSLLRRDATEFDVTDRTGALVLAAALPVLSG